MIQQHKYQHPPTTNQYGETYVNYRVRFGDGIDPEKIYTIRMKMNSTILEMKQEIAQQFNNGSVGSMDIGSFWDFKEEGNYHIYDNTFKFNKIMNKEICVYNQGKNKNKKNHQIKKIKNSGSEICLKEYIKTYGCKCQNCQYNESEEDDEDDIDINTYFIDVEHRKRISNIRVIENETTVEAVLKSFVMCGGIQMYKVQCMLPTKKEEWIDVDNCAKIRKEWGYFLKIMKK